MAPILKYPEPTEEFAIKTYASQVSLGVFLNQKYKIKGKKILKPVLLASSIQKGAERR